MQLRHVVWYELGFCHMFNLDWSKGRASFAKLERDNDWSRAFYAYMQAVSTNCRAWGATSTCTHIHSCM